MIKLKPIFIKDPLGLFGIREGAVAGGYSLTIGVEEDKVVFSLGAVDVYVPAADVGVAILELLAPARPPECTEAEAEAALSQLLDPATATDLGAAWDVVRRYRDKLRRKR